MKFTGLSRQKMTGVCATSNTCDYTVPSYKRILLRDRGKSKVIFYSKMKIRIFHNTFKINQTCVLQNAKEQKTMPDSSSKVTIFQNLPKYLIPLNFSLKF